MLRAVLYTSLTNVDNETVSSSLSEQYYSISKRFTSLGASRPLDIHQYAVLVLTMEYTDRDVQFLRCCFGGPSTIKELISAR